MSRLRTWSIAGLAVSATVLAGCSSSATPSTATSPPTTAVSATPTTSGPPTTIPTTDRSAAGTAGTAPTLTVPAGQPPTRLETADLITGTGPVAKAGDTVTVQYVLATYSSRKVVQSSWTAQPFSFMLDATPEAVIPGWDAGVAGMQVGGRRELIIPPSLGYGNQVPGAGIAANDTLVFIVDLLKIN
jgi:peptidylprolyl isomerase